VFSFVGLIQVGMSNHRHIEFRHTSALPFATISQLLPHYHHHHLNLD
jgi:hypothetical protein